VEKNSKEIFCLSFISVQELYEGRSTANEIKEKELLSVISPLKLLPYTYEVAKLAGILARDLNRPIELADAAIAATAIIANAPLCTLNVKDFALVPGLELYSLQG
jgi:predicted nucleic acid-binding protein